jgi:hypothetical protein
MTKRILAVALLVGLGAIAWLVLRGNGHTATTTSSTAGAPVATQSVETYFYLGAALVPDVVQVPKTTSVATAATRALLAGAPAGYRTALPAGAKLESLTIAAETARASFSRALVGLPRTAQAQIVYTLTQFPTVNKVLIVAGESPLALSNGAEKPTLGAATRTDYVDLTQDAQIFVASPTRDSTVTSPVTISGTASVFEATLTLEVWTGTTMVDSQTLTATRGAPERGTFTGTVALPPGKHKLVLYEPSAKDGSHLHTTTVEITVVP